MARYLPNTVGSSAPFDAGRRPPLDALPKPLADKLKERDRIKAQRHAAQTRVAELGTDQAMTAAQQADDDAGAKAARAGKPIPPATAVARLEADRADAARALEAQSTALVTVTGELDYLASDIRWAGAEEAAAERDELRAGIEAKAAALADEVEAAVARFAVHDWLAKGVYNTSVQTWPTDVVDLERFNLTRKTTTPVNVRDVIIAAATTALTED